jgi:hypothetical protein
MNFDQRIAAVFQRTAEMTDGSFVVWLNPKNTHAWRRAHETHHEDVAEVLPGFGLGVSQVRFDMGLCDVPRIAHDYACTRRMFPFLPRMENAVPSVVAVMVANAFEDAGSQLAEDFIIDGLACVMDDAIAYQLVDIASVMDDKNREQVYHRLFRAVEGWIEAMGKTARRLAAIKPVFPTDTSAKITLLRMRRKVGQHRIAKRVQSVLYRIVEEPAL